MKTLNKELLKEKIEFLAQSELADNKMFGSSYCVYQDGETVYKNHFGYCDVQGKNPVNDKTMYRIASMTKPVTAAAANCPSDEDHSHRVRLRRRQQLR